jgi:ABC-2 type transport system ATP-binding protein
LGGHALRAALKKVLAMMSREDFVIETNALTKNYDGFTAVDALDLNVRRGEVYGLLGPNGSGKTTTILMLLGLTEPSAGTARILGFDPVREPLKVKERVGYMPDQVGFYDGLTARQNLIYIGKLIGLDRREIERRVASAIDRMGLGSVIDQRVGTFSHGMRQRLGVAEVLLKDPEIIILDEPTGGLDPDAARRFSRTILGLKEAGITILLSSHLLQQVQQVCDRVGLFKRGRIVLEGTVPDLARQVLGTGYFIDIRATGGAERLLDPLRSISGVREVEFIEPDRYALEAEQDLRADAARAVVEHGGDLRSLSIKEANLDEIYEKYFEGLEAEEHVRPAA